MDEIFWTQKVNGRWKQYQPVRMDKIDNFLPFSIIKWTRRSPDKTNLWGLVNRESTIIAYGVPMQLPYVINRLWLHFLIKKTGKFILIRGDDNKMLMSQKSLKVCPFASFPDHREISQSIQGNSCYLTGFKIGEIINPVIFR